MRAPPLTMDRARTLRRALTPPEARLWLALKRKRLDGLHFRKQHPVGPYILDFYGSAVGLAVEVDGLSHDTDARGRHDERRDAWLAGQGVRVLRVSAEAGRLELDMVLAYIGEVAREGPPQSPR